jgi:hypothetical protein
MIVMLSGAASFSAGAALIGSASWVNGRKNNPRRQGENRKNGGLLTK